MKVARFPSLSGSHDNQPLPLPSQVLSQYITQAPRLAIPLLCLAQFCSSLCPLPRVALSAATQPSPFGNSPLLGAQAQGPVPPGAFGSSHCICTSPCSVL